MPETLEQSAGPTLAEAYAAGTMNDTGVEGTRKPERTLSEEKPVQREATPAENPRREPTLAEAYENVVPEPAEEFSLPAEFAAYSAEDIAAVCGLLGLEESDLKEPRFAALALKELEASFPQIGDEEAEEEEETETEEEAETQEDEAPEEKPAEKPVDVAHAVLAPTELESYMDRTFEKVAQVSSPQISEEFALAVNGILTANPQSEAERYQNVRTLCKVMEWGGVSLMQSALPAMVDQYMQENFAPNLMRAFSHVLEQHLPGVTESFHRDTATRTWDAVRSEDDRFADLPDFESQEFVQLRDRIRAANPWIDGWDPDPKMPPLQALKAKAQLFARLALGERVDPKRVAQQISDALVTGKRSAEKSNRRVSAGRMLGRGRTSGTIGDQKERSSLMDAWNSRHSGDGGIR
jgi:hypothetical protein